MKSASPFHWALWIYIFFYPIKALVSIGLNISWLTSGLSNIGIETWYVCVCVCTYIPMESSFGEQPGFTASLKSPPTFFLSPILSNDVKPMSLGTKTEEAGVRISYCLMPPTGTIPFLLDQTDRSQNRLFLSNSLIYASGSFWSLSLEAKWLYVLGLDRVKFCSVQSLK